MPICKKCNKEFKGYQKINGEWKYLFSRKYCLRCSPYKKHNTKKLHVPDELGIDIKSEKLCPKCNKKKKLNEFYKRESGGYSSYCKLCCSNSTKDRQIKLKKEAVEYLGGKCLICGYNKYYGALEFHHLEPSKKDYIISKSKLLNLDKVKKELNKCICLCRSCHAEVHGKLINIKKFL